MLERFCGWVTQTDNVNIVATVRVMRVYNPHTKKKAYVVSKMTSWPAAEGEVCSHVTLQLFPLSFFS